jgi:hypothetical protein
MAAWSRRDEITELVHGRSLKVVIFDAPAVKELAKLERQDEGNSWARFEALARRLADYGKIFDDTAFRHEFSGIYAIKAKRIRAFGVFASDDGGQRFFGHRVRAQEASRQTVEYGSEPHQQSSIGI